MRFTSTKIFAIAVVVITLMPIARASEGTFSISFEYAHLDFNSTAARRLDNESGARIEPRVSFAPSDNLPQLRLGFGLGIWGWRDERDEDNNATGTDRFVDRFEQLALITPEFQISWHQPLDREQHWFIEPGVGVGVAIGNYRAGDSFFFEEETDIDRWDANFEARPFLRAGYQWDRWAAGVEASYLWTNLDFDDGIDGDVRAFAIGGFFSIRF